MKIHCLAVLMFATTARAWTTLVLNNNNDSGAGSLRQAILDANALGGATITFRSVTGTILLERGLPILTTPITILGPGAAQLVVKTTSSVVLTNAAGNTAHVRGLTFTGLGDLGTVRNF